MGRCIFLPLIVSCGKDDTDADKTTPHKEKLIYAVNSPSNEKKNTPYPIQT
jgi:hypothetical protein